jgi:hypothetical protein
MMPQAFAKEAAGYSGGTHIALVLQPPTSPPLL